MKRTTALSVGLCLTALTFASAANAAVISYNLTTEFSGATAPVGPSPWATATIDDSFGGANTARLTMTAVNLTGSEFIAGWYFNLNPALNPTSLTFNQISSGATVTSVNTGVNAFQADGDGTFDILFNFSNAAGAGRFNDNESVVYDITYTSALTAADFDFGSAPGGGNGTWRTAAHVQGIGTNAQGSGWIGGNPGGTPVPEPASLLLLGLGFAALGGRALKHRRA
jgi:hypothetical protein